MNLFTESRQTVPWQAAGPEYWLPNLLHVLGSHSHTKSSPVSIQTQSFAFLAVFVYVIAIALMLI